MAHTCSQSPFEEGTDLDIAMVKVQNRVAQAEPTLPTAVKQQGVTVSSRSSNEILFISLQSDDPERYDALYLTNYANLNITDELSRVDGVGNVEAFGGGQYSMRIWLDPAKMRERGITPADVVQAIQSQNMEVSAGSVGARPSSSKRGVHLYAHHKEPPVVAQAVQRHYPAHGR